ncbi:MAG: hypothetical protein H6Q72_4198 [Firmicutes bacterium]|nr:hypothetical protein [Bacillota bacterium]
MDIIPADERCSFCKRNKATLLCDYPVGEWISPHMVLKHGKKVTCDRPICESCATHLGYETDFCPKCMKKVKDLAK